MRLFWATAAIPSYRAKIHPALTSFADECRGMLAHLVAYVGALALLAILGMVLWDQIPAELAGEPAATPGWSPASLSYPSFAVSQFDLAEKAATYEVLRHPEGSRKDILRWAAQGETRVAELEIYRPSGEFDPSRRSATEFATQIGLKGVGELETAGVIDSKFDGRRKPPFARRNLIRRGRQDAGFHATFSARAALCEPVWPD
jgi:hypothetical protein